MENRRCSVSVNRQPDSNTVQVAEEVHQEMARSARRCRPASRAPFYDHRNIVQESIASVRDAIIIGLFLAGLIHLALPARLGHRVDDRARCAGAMVITFIVMKALGQSFNLMTLGGLAAAVGLVIDDRSVVVENIVLHRDSAKARCRRRPVRSRADRPADWSTLTPIVVFLPLITITGVTGRSSARWRSR